MAKKDQAPWQKELYEIIYKADTPYGKAFDVVLLIIIFVSVLFVMIESVSGLHPWVYHWLHIVEWIVTILFSIEYIARIICIKKPRQYLFSFYGIIDFLSTIPLYITLIFAGSSALITFRALRLLRVFRILKVSRYIGEGNRLMSALRDSRPKILIFLFAVVILSLIAGTAMYLIEGGESGFTSIPVSLYWCIVTLTTVGFGDIHPVTPLGQALASIIMILGYGIIAVPTGIVSAEYSRATDPKKELASTTKFCNNCGERQHMNNAKYCSNCGQKLNNE